MCQVDALGLPGLLALLLLLVLAYVLQVVVHEGGHLVCGLLTGYRALSFRIGRMLLVKLDGRWKLRAYHIPGTGGQCLMAPPAQERPLPPGYHLGRAGQSAAGRPGLCRFFCTGAPLLRVFAGALVLIGGWIAGTNLIPMKMGGVANDGYNARNLGKDPLALQCSCVQLWIVEALQEGYSLADMPEEWFALPPKADLQNVLIMGTAIQRASRLMARGELEEADRAIRELLCGGHDLLGLHRLELTCEEIYCALVLGRVREAERLFTPEVRRYCRQTRKYCPGRVRQAYAWALLAERDVEKARDLRAEFERAAARYPYSGELAGERNLLDRADQAFRASSTQDGRAEPPAQKCGKNLRLSWIICRKFIVSLGKSLDVARISVYSCICNQIVIFSFPVCYFSDGMFGNDGEVRHGEYHERSQVYWPALL